MSTSILLCSSTPTGLRRSGGFTLNRPLDLAILAQKRSLFFAGCQSLIHPSHGVQIMNKSNRKFAVFNSVQPSGPPSSGSWNGWILGAVLTFVLPFLTNKWGPLLKIKNEFETAVQTVENVVDAVEKVAEQVEKVAEDIAEGLPAGKLKNAVTFIENVADQIDDTAEVVGDAIDKVQEVEEQVESAVESALDGEKEAIPDEAKEPAKEVKAET
ncbi:uncharacterized protein LOC113749850 [Coffea eugenioides]|uniref:Uncharacterized protein n=1 Tax=Coffea arabica TaxID=13443 RepID=A0A6P6UXI2_COFAR|nr:uncharacterized protein LOC113715128 [Coffea arabica]XP_027149519.1 uncharacterized protein LOC113749850 [Coffea eugenioides]